MTKINIQPLGTRVLIKPLEQESKTASGLLLPDTAKEKPQTGLVVAVGDDEEIKLKVNDKVLFARYSGTEFKMDGIGEDIFFLSNGHISPVFYSVLARSGYFPVAELSTFRKIDSRLQGHPTTHEHLPGVRIASYAPLGLTGAA